MTEYSQQCSPAMLARCTAWVCAMAVLLFALTGALNVLAHPGYGLDVDSRGNIFFSDVHRRTVWKLGAAGNLSPFARDRWAHALCVDDQDVVWIEEEVNNTQYRVWRIAPDGTATSVLGPIERGLDFHGASLLADADGRLFFPHSNPPHFSNSGVRQRTAAGAVSLLAGSDEYGHRDGVGPAARFNGIDSMRFGSDGAVLVLDVDAIRRVSRAGEVTTLFHGLKDAMPEDQPFDNGNPRVSNRLYGFDLNAAGEAIVAYHGNRRVLRLSPDGGREVIYRSTKPWSPVGVCFHGGKVLIKESGLEPGSDLPGPRIRSLRPDGTVETLITLGDADFSPATTTP